MSLTSPTTRALAVPPETSAWTLVPPLNEAAPPFLFRAAPTVCEPIPQCRSSHGMPTLAPMPRPGPITRGRLTLLGYPVAMCLSPSPTSSQDRSGSVPCDARFPLLFPPFLYMAPACGNTGGAAEAFPSSIWRNFLEPSLSVDEPSGVFSLGDGYKAVRVLRSRQLSDRYLPESEDCASRRFFFPLLPGSDPSIALSVVSL